MYATVNNTNFSVSVVKIARPNDGSIVFGCERMTAVRLALGAALSNPRTAALSSRELARLIGCGETTVRRYRKIAKSIGLESAFADPSKACVCSVPESLFSDAMCRVHDIMDFSADQADERYKPIHLKAKAIWDLLSQKCSREEISFLHNAVLTLEKVVDDLLIE